MLGRSWGGEDPADATSPPCPARRRPGGPRWPRRERPAPESTGSPSATAGEILRDPDLARTLRLIAAQGAEPFYEGAIARDSVAAVRTEANPGLLTLADLAGYEVKERPPVRAPLPRLGGLRHGPAVVGRADCPEADGKPAANRVEGGKRPRSSMAPTIVLENGAPVLLIGSPGGSSIIPHVAQALVGILDFGQEPQAAIDAPHVLNRNGPTLVEAGPEADATIAALAGLGQQAEATDPNSGLHAILLRDGQLVGAADKRREGLVMGE